MLERLNLRRSAPVYVSRRGIMRGLATLLASPALPAAASDPSLVEAVSFGVKANGHDADDDALDLAIAAAVELASARQRALESNQYFRSGVRLRLPNGPIRLMRGHVVQSGHVTVEGGGSGVTVLLKAGGDFGDLLEIRDTRDPNNVGGGGFSRLSAIDLGPTSHGALLRLTGCENGSTHDVATHNGFFGLQLDGVSNYVVDLARCTGDRYFGQTAAQVARGEQGSAKPQSALIALTYHAGGIENTNIQMSDLTATGESPQARLHHAAIRVESADVLLLRTAELGAVTEADLLIEVGGSRSIQGLQTSGIEFDNGANYGLKLAGTTTGAVGDWIVEGRFFGHDRSHVSLESGALAGATFRIDGLGAGRSPVVVAAGTDITFVAPILRGFAHAATAPRQLSGIDVATDSVSVLGGMLKPFASRDLAYAIRLGDNAVGCVVADTVSAPGAHAYGAVRCRDLLRNRVNGNLVIGGASEVGRV